MELYNVQNMEIANSKVNSPQSLIDCASQMYEKTIFFITTDLDQRIEAYSNLYSDPLYLCINLHYVKRTSSC